MWSPRYFRRKSERLTTGVQHSAGGPEEGMGLVVQVVAPARDRSCVVENVAVVVAIESVSCTSFHYTTL